MGHRNVTISDEAYSALSRLKNGKESFTDVILRLASSRGSAARLLAYLRELSPSEELARGIEFSMNRTRKATLPKVPLE